jgi:cytochrome P450
MSTAEMGNTPLPYVDCDAAGTWHVRGYPEANTILKMHVTQAGFEAEAVLKTNLKFVRFLLILDGDEHKQQRRMAARFFTPVMVNKSYKPMIENVSDAVLHELATSGKADFTGLSACLSATVVCHILGLLSVHQSNTVTRLCALVNNQAPKFTLSPKSLFQIISGFIRVAQFWLFDVRPAVRERREHPQEDMISHLISHGADNMTILTQCLLYGGAGVATTQEFLCRAAQELILSPALQMIALTGNETELHSLLSEILRIHPVITKLIRRTVEALSIESNGAIYTIPAGALIEFHVKAINTDQRVLGADADTIVPSRHFNNEIPWSLLTFGSGPHRCPGEALALAQGTVFLRRLLQTGSLKVDRFPIATVNPSTGITVLKEFMISLSN